MKNQADMGKRAKIADRRRGNAAIEVAMLSPWILFVFLGIFDAGFYMYAAISTANAARVAALYTSGGPSTLADSLGACQAALEEMRQLPNVKTSVACPASCAAGSACTAGPVTFTAVSQSAGADGSPASQVTVQYQTVQLITIPGLAGQMTLKRTVQMRERL
jgi:Flp pilus assembly protein TadG